MCSLVMSLYSHDFLMMSLYIPNNNNKLTLHSAWLLDDEHQLIVVEIKPINLVYSETDYFATV